MATVDEILKKYGVTQVKGSEKSGSTTSTKKSASKSTGDPEADAILKKYGIKGYADETEATGTTGDPEADDILEKYGVSIVRGSEKSDSNTKGLTAKYTDSAQSWLESSLAFLKDSSSYTKKYLGSWHTKDSDYYALMKRSSDLLSDAYVWKNQYAGDEKASADFDEVIDAIWSSRDTFKSYFDHYGQWETAEDYNFWESRNTAEKRQNLYAEQEKRLEELKAEKEALQKQMYSPNVGYPGYGASSNVGYTGYGASSKIHEAASQENIKRLGAIDDEITSIEMEMANYNRGNYNDRGQHYGSKVVDDYSAYTKEFDFDTKSANRAFANPTKDELINYDAMSDSSTWYFDADGTYRDAFGNELKVDESGNWVNPAAGDYPVADRLGMFLSASEDDKVEASATTAGTEGVWANVLKDGIDGDWDQLEKGEISIYYYLLNSQGQQAADKYLSDMKTELNRRGTMKYIEKLSKAFDEANTLERIALSLATTPAQFVSGATGFIEDAINVLSGNDINPYSAAHAGTAFSTTVRSKQAEAWDEATGGIAIPFINFSVGDLYQAGMSALDMFAGSRLGPGAYEALMGMGSASSEAKRLYEQGATTEQIAWGAGLAGGAEMVFEHLSIESLIKLKDAKTVGQFVKNALIQGGIEASEEGFTEIANTITNAIVMGDESDWAKLLEKHGGDYLGALIEKTQEVGSAAFSGFVSGGLGGITHSVPSYASNKLQLRSDGQDIIGKDGGVDELLQLAKDVAGASAAKQRSITKLTEKVAKKATAGRVGLLNDMIKNANNQANAADIVKSLEGVGFNKETAKDIADALMASYNGQELTDSQEKLLKDVSGNDLVKSALEGLVGNPESQFAQRNQKVTNFAMDIAIDRAKKTLAKEVNKKEFTPEREYKVSETEKAIRIDTNEEIDIKGVASVSKGKLMLELADGQTIDAKSVSFANEADALIYEAVARLGDNIDPDTANKLVSKFDGGNAMVFARGMAQAYTWGFYGFDKAELSSESALTSELTPEQINTAYGLGAQYRPVKDTKDRDNARATKAPVEKGVYYRDKDGNATDIETYMKENGKKLNARQKTAVEVMRKFSETMGARFHVFESWVENGKNYYLDENGEVVEGNPNGFYDTTTGEIYIALDAGAIEANGFRDTMLFTIAHEMTHFMRQWSPEHFTKISKIIFQQAGFKGHMSELVAVKQAKAKAKGKPISYDTAVEEVVADGMETILKDGKVVEFMADVKKKDHTAWQKLKGWFKNLEKFLRKLVTAYRYETANTIEGDMVANFANDLIRQIQQIWAEGAVAAGENYQAVDGYKAEQEQMSTDTIRGSADGAVMQSEVTEAIAESKQQIRTEFEALPKQVMNLSDGAGTILHLIEGLTPTKVNGLSGRGINGYTGRDVRAWAMKNSGFTPAQIKQVNKFMDTMADFMEEAGVTYKFIGLQDVQDAKLHYTYNADGSIKSIVLSAMVKNGDYPVNFDLSSICKKRVAMSKLIDKLAKRGSLDNGTVKLTPANIFKINTALKNEGYETACLGCFVESKRYNSLEWAKKFCNKWNAAVKKVNPNATYFGYGDDSFSDDSFTLEQAVKIDNAANKYIKATKTERLANALVKYKAKAQAGQPLVESFSKAAKDRLIKSETISEELKTKYLNCDPKTLNIADVEFLLENGILPGAALSNKQAVTEMVKSGEAYQHLLRPSDLLTDRGISKLEALPNFHGVLYGHYGSGTPKLMQSYTPYNSEIALLPAKKGDLSLAEYLYSIAGVRMQSFSDFQIQNIYDYLQMVGDLAARKVPAHAYTKELPFAKLLGMTGIKVNLSVMFDIDPMVDKAHAGLTKLNKLVHRGEYAKVVLEDAQGKWVYNIGDYQTQKLFAEAYPDQAKRFLQSIGFGDAVKLQSSPGYSANCGIIGVGYSDLGIFAMLNDNRIRYIIPYHASSLPAEIKLATNIALGTDYTPYQNNMKIKEIVDRNGNKVNWTIKEAYKRLGSGQTVINELNEKIRTEGWVVSTSKAQTGHGSYGLYEDLQQTNDPRQTASNFMDWCIGNSTLPLFYQFASHENYYKLLYDYNVYDCVTEEYAPQQAVTNTYPTMVDGQVQPGNVTDGGFDAEYFKGAIDKQMAFMNEYSRNLDEDLDALAENLEDGNYTLRTDRNPMLTEADLDEYLRTGQTMHTRNKKQRMMEAGKNPILTTIADVKAFMGNVIRGRAGGEVRAFGKVGSRLAGAIMDIRESLDLTGNYLELNADDLREAYKMHSTPKEAGDVPLTEADFESIPEYLDEFDGVLSVNEYNGKVDVHIYKRVSEDYVRILAVSSKERRSLQVTKLIGVSSKKFETKYAKKIERTTGSLRSASEESEDSNPSTKAQLTAGGLSGARVTQPDGNVKRSDRDTTYLDAVNRGDMKTAQRMVDEAAKKAGFPVRLLHGTQKFGFTVPDTSMSDDKLSFFATNEVDTAKTYSSLPGKRRIAEDANYDDIESENEALDEAARDGAYDLAHAISSWAGYYGAADADFIYDEFDRIANAGDGFAITGTADGDMYDVADEIIANLYDEDLHDGMEFWEWQETDEGEDLYTKVNKTIAKFLAKYEFDTNAQRSGNYDLYANTDGLLVIEGNGAKWDDIKSDLLPDITSDEGKKYGYRGHWDKWTTRSISKYASDNGYRGVLFKNIYDDGGKSSSGVRKPADVYSFFYPQEQIKSADPVTYDDSGNVIPLSQRFNTEKDDIRYSDRDTESVSNRSLLANAFEGMAQNDIERNKIKEYKDKIALINAEEKKLRELNAQIKELSFAKGPKDTKKLKALRFDANQAANRINTYDKQLLRLEASQPLQDVLAREKKRAYAKAAQRGREALAEYKAKAKAQQKETVDKWRESRKTAVAKARETADKRDARAKLQKLVLDTVKWISYPAKTDVKCPDILKKPYKDFLDGIDLSSERLANGGDPTKNDLRLANAMDSLATALDRVMTAQDPSQEVDKVLDIGYLDLPANFVSQLRDMTEAIKAMMVEGDYVVNTMTAAEVRKLSQMIRTLNHAIKTMSKLYANLRFANVEALGFDTMDFLDALGEIEKTGGMKDFVQWDNALPYYAFKRFGKGGESVFEGLMDAQDKLAFLAQEIFNFQEKTWTSKEAKEWSEDTHTIDLPNGNKLTLTTADAMSIYCLSRRQQGIQHLLGGGVRVIGIQKGSTKAKDSRSLLTIEDVDAIISSLTDRQKQVAEGIQEFMSTVCSEWGNEISMKRFLTKEFTEKFYFPIESNDENLTAKDPAAQQSDLFRLLNISATKPLTQGANNEVIVRNIFDVFTGHASDMARLNAYGMGLLDYMKWLNYREKVVNEAGQINVKGVRKSMEKAFGKAANSYVLNLIKDVNGRASDGGDPNILMKWMRSAKTASVGNSLRVATLQITSYPRAALVLSPKSLAIGLSKKPNIKKAKKYCGIALWKSFGFYDTNISRSIEDQMKGVTNVKQKLIELSLKGAEIGDAITWGALWNACEYEVAAEKKFEVGTEEFNQAVAKKLREVVYRTQVVDSTLTRSQMMRSKRGMAQEAAAFMSEPTLSANILMDAGFEFTLEKRRTGSAKAAWKKTGSYIGRAVAVYSIGQLAAALMEGLWDAWRDDEDEEFGEKFLRAFGENLALDLIPFNKIPIISDVFEAALSMFGVGFYSSDKMSTTWLTQALSAVEAWKEVLGGSSSVTAYNALYKTVRSVSSFYGFSFSGVMREGVALWNNTAGSYDATLKVLTYDRSNAELGGLLLDAILEGDDRQADSLRAEFEDEDASQSALRSTIKERYEAGDIDSETAMSYLTEYAGMEDSDAYWKVEEWEYESESGEDFGKYDEFFTAVETGKNLRNVIKQYTDNGVKPETLATQITSHFKPIYGEMTASQRAKLKGYLLNAFELCGMDREKASDKIAEWQFEVDHP